MLRTRNKRHHVPELNTTSTADISFMLLTFFLVTTSMETDKGIVQQLPPLPDNATQRQVTDVKRRNVLVIGIDAADRIDCNGRAVEAQDLQSRVMEFIDNAGDSPELPEKVMRDIPLLGRCAVTANHLIFIRADRAATYDAYFGVQDAIAAAYAALRDRLTVRRFGRRYAECTPEQQAAARQCYPQRLSEGQFVEEGGDR